MESYASQLHLEWKLYSGSWQIKAQVLLSPYDTKQVNSQSPSVIWYDCDKYNVIIVVMINEVFAVVGLPIFGCHHCHHCQRLLIMKVSLCKG